MSPAWRRKHPIPRRTPPGPPRCLSPSALLLAAVAEHEREMISKRTQAALRAAKARGTVLGNPNSLPASRQAIAALKVRTEQFHATVKPLIQNLRQQGYSLAKIAKELNDRHVPTARGRRWYPATVRNILTHGA